MDLQFFSQEISRYAKDLRTFCEYLTSRDDPMMDTISQRLFSAREELLNIQRQTNVQIEQLAQTGSHLIALGEQFIRAGNDLTWFEGWLVRLGNHIIGLGRRLIVIGDYLVRAEQVVLPDEVPPPPMIEVFDWQQAHNDDPHHQE